MASAARVDDFLDFVGSSPTPFHAVQSAIKRLEASVLPNPQRLLRRRLRLGAKWKSGNPIAILGAHTDSPTLRLKPVSKKTNSGFLQIGVETYGGGIWHTWFDRDLSIAGRVMVRDKEGNFVQTLVKVDRPIVRIPTLAIHLDRSSEFNPNKETELFAVAGLVAAELNRTGVKPDEKKSASEADEDPRASPLRAMTERHHPYIMAIIAEHAGVAVQDVIDFELVLYDTQPAVPRRALQRTHLLRAPRQPRDDLLRRPGSSRPSPPPQRSTTNPPSV
ncbi:hypothetical protein VE04_09604 [Pseudogymnoascus sp. 24MN13]|nr:hypothetical protein VE04_09604 [Pseudogymnoascus sp. 24MN13]